MGSFACNLQVYDVPSSVQAGQTVSLRVRAKVKTPGQTLGFVMLHIQSTGELLRFAKKSEEEYVLGYKIPKETPRGTYCVSVYATGDDGMTSCPQSFYIQIL